MDEIEMYVEAFKTSDGGAVRKCKCGSFFYNSNGGWDFLDGELESLRGDMSATDLPDAVGMVRVNGTLYVTACSCWHDVARRVMDFLDENVEQVAAYYKLKAEAAEASASRFRVAAVNSSRAILLE